MSIQPIHLSHSDSRLSESDFSEKIRPLKKAMAFVLGVDRSTVLISQEVVLHGVPLRLYFENQEQHKRITSLFPSSWLHGFSIDEASLDGISGDGVCEAQEIYLREGFFTQDNVWDDANPDCEQHFVNGETIVVQRDFIARKNGRETVALLAPQETDSIYNFLRWFLPPLLLQRGKMLVHSSARVNSAGKAHLCLGASGAGKSTIIGMVDPLQVLGDDMNIISQHEGVFFAEAAAVGQAVQNSQLIGCRFLVESIFCLTQSDENSLQKMDPARAALNMMAGVANVFNSEVSNEAIEQIQAIVSGLCTEVTFYNLDFNLDGKVWEYVAREI